MTTCVPASFDDRCLDAWAAMSGDDGLGAVVELLDDETARTIQEETSVEPLSARELAERCDTSRQTVYRRLEQLEASELVEDRTRVREDGHHDTVYTATLERLSITLREGELRFDVERTSASPADRLTDLWRNF